MFKAISATLSKKPLITQCIVTSTLFCTGDVVNQQIIERRGFSKHDWASTLRMGSYGGLIFAPIVVPWYKLLDTRIVFASAKKQLIARVAADQLVFAPFGIALFLSTMSAVKGADPVAAIREKWWDTLKANWVIWPAVQLANFGIVPLAMRLTVVNVVSIGWNAYLASTQQEKGVVEEIADEAHDVKEKVHEKLVEVRK